MENDNKTLNTILGAIGILAVSTLIFQLVKSLEAKTETNLISKDAFNTIQDPKKAIQLREAIDQYHNTGDWKKTKLESIL